MRKNVTPVTPSALRLRNGFIIFLFLTVAVLGTIFFLTRCRVKTVVVKSEGYVPEPVISDAVTIKQGTHLYAVDEEKIEAAIMNASPYVKSVTLKRKLPSELQILVEEYVLAYYIEYADICYLITDELLVLEATTPEDAAAKGAIPLALPKLQDPKATKENPNPPKVLTVGKKLAFAETENLAWVKKLLSAIRSTDFAERITKIDLSDPYSLRVFVENKYEVRLGVERDFEKKLARVENALRYLEASLYALKGVLHAEKDQPVTFSFTGVIEETT